MDEDGDEDEYEAYTEAVTDYGSTFEADSEYDSDAGAAMQAVIGADAFPDSLTARASAQVRLRCLLACHPCSRVACLPHLCRS